MSRSYPFFDFEVLGMACVPFLAPLLWIHDALTLYLPQHDFHGEPTNNGKHEIRSYLYLDGY